MRNRCYDALFILVAHFVNLVGIRCIMAKFSKLFTYGRGRWIDENVGGPHDVVAATEKSMMALRLMEMTVSVC